MKTVNPDKKKKREEAVRKAECLLVLDMVLGLVGNLGGRGKAGLDDLEGFFQS